MPVKVVENILHFREMDTVERSARLLGRYLGRPRKFGEAKASLREMARILIHAANLHKKANGNARLLQSMLGQLRTMAEAERCDMLTYLIEMAYVEASDIIRGERPARVQQDRRKNVA